MLSKNPSKHQGFVTIVVVMMIILLATIITLMTARYIINDQHLFRNTYQTAQAQNLSQGGFDYGLAYLNKNFSTVTDGTTLTNANDSQLPANLSILYTYVGNNKLIQIQATGNTMESTAAVSTDVVTGLAKRFTGNTVSYPANTVSNVSMQNNSVITNLEGPITISTGQTVSLQNNAKTILSSGVSSTTGNIRSDVLQNQTELQLTQTDLQLKFLGMLMTDFDSAQVRTMRLPVTGAYLSSQNFNTPLGGVTGQVIYIDMNGTNTANFSSGVIVGSTANPVTIIVNGKVSLSSGAVVNGNVYATGDISMSGNASATVNGLVFSLGEIKMTGNSSINGGAIAYEDIEMQSNTSLNYSSSILSSAGSGMMQYGLVPGSWKDF